MRARVGIGYPPLPLHGAACWLGVLFMSLVNFTGEFLPALRGNKQHDERNERDECAHAYVYERIYMLMFFSKFLHEWTWNSTTPEGPSIPTPNQTGRDMGVAFFLIETRAWTWIYTTHTSLSFRDTPKPGVPVATGSVCVRMPLIKLRGYMVAYYVGYHPPPEQASPRLTPTFGVL